MWLRFGRYRVASFPKPGADSGENRLFSTPPNARVIGFGTADDIGFSTSACQGFSMSNWIHTAHLMFTQQIVPSLAEHPLPILLVLAFVAMNILLYGLTTGREFLINGAAAALFLIPLLRLA